MWLLAAVGALWLLLLESRALAQDAGSVRAAELAEAARSAHSAGAYDFAIQAYEQAHALDRKPDLLFSLAESYRQRYAAEGEAYDLLRAVEHYRRYLEVSPRGAHRGSAERALSTLAADAEGAPVDDADMARVAAERISATRLSVSSNVLGAEARIDGGPAQKLPLFVIVAPGKHTLTVRASGYEQEDRVITIGKGTVYPVTAHLHPLAAKLSVDGPSGAGVRVDGTFMGVLPLAKPIELDPGSHRVEVVMSGHEAYARRIELARGKEAKLSVDLEQTTQRVASWYLIGAGGVAVGTGVAFGVASVVKHREGREMLQDDFDGLDPDKRRELRETFDARDDFRIGSGIAAGTGLGLFLLGGVLFAFDTPEGLDGPEETRSDAGMSASPLLGPGLAGGEMVLRF